MLNKSCGNFSKGRWFSVVQAPCSNTHITSIVKLGKLKSLEKLSTKEYVPTVAYLKAEDVKKRNRQKKIKR